MPKTFLAAVTLMLLLWGPVSAADANLIWTWTGDCVTNNSSFFVPIPLCHHAVFVAVTTDAYVPGLEGPFYGGMLLNAFYLDDIGGFDSFASAEHPFDGNHFIFPPTNGEGFG